MHLIEGYEFGRILIDGKTYRADLLILPDGIHPDWWRQEGHALAVVDLWELTQCEPLPEVLVVGTGSHGRMVVLPETEQWLKENGVELRALPTAEACKVYNALVEKGVRAAAALHLTC